MNVMKKIIRILELLIVIIACYFPLCYRIDALPINQWDEARNAVHTVEMLQNHKYLVRTYQGVAETWEPKPPLLVWLQLASTKIFGLNELAIRFPIMVATFLTVIMLILYFARFFNNRYLGYLSALVLVTSQGYIDRHIARTGDHDALLVLITTAIILHFYLLLNSERPGKSGFIVLSLLFIIGVFTKSVAVFFILPGLIISIPIFGKLERIFGNKWFYIALLVFIVPVSSYYVAREMAQPGYLSAVWHWELIPRYTNPDDKFLKGTFWYYAVGFYKSRFTYWIWFLLPAIIILPFKIKDRLLNFFFFLLLQTLLLFLILSIGSKNLWYDGPLFPLFAIIIAIALERVLKFINKAAQSNVMSVWLRRVIIFIITIMIFYFPYMTIIKKVRQSQVYPWDMETYSMCHVLSKKEKLHTMPDPLKVVFEGYKAHLLFYTEARNFESKKDRIQLTDISGISNTDTILISQQQVMDSIIAKFDFEVLIDKNPVKLIKIGG